jgi:hypothetical protein
MFTPSFIQRIIRYSLHGLGVWVLLLLGGCSTIALVYRQADDVVYWWLDGYVDLQGQQKPFVQHSLAHLHQWHRQTQLPEYIVFLQKVRALAPHDIQPEQTCAIIQEVQNSLIGVLQHIEPDASKLISQLSATQLQHVRQKYDKLNKEWREDYLEGSDEKRLRFRTKQATKRLEDFYGNLDAPQRAVLQQWLTKSVFQPGLSYDERLRRQADALQTFTRIAQHGVSPSAAQAQFRSWVERSFESPDEAYHTYSLALKKENCEGFAKLHNSMSPAQRERLAENLRNYEGVFQGLLAKK